MGNDVSATSGRKVTLDDFDLVRLVGKGAFGKVWQVRRKDTGEIFALKILDKKTVVEQNLVEHTVFERDVMLSCNNPFIINLYYTFQNEENLYFVLDFVGGGSLFTVLRDHPLGYFPESHGKFYAAEILLGIEELHKNGIAYRDLKLENVLLGIDGHIILTDFGLSARLPKNEEGGKLHSFSGTAIYLAPEVLLGEGHDQSVDWWSYGILVHLLLTGEPPFWSENRRELFDMIVFGQTIIDDPLLTPEARDLITKLLNRNTKKRIGCTTGAEEIKKHKFFSGINWNSVYKRKMKPPIVPDQEFLLTTRTEPLQLPSRSGDTSSGSEEVVQSDYDFFQGFSFASNKQPNHGGEKILQKLIHSDNIRPGEKKLRRKDKKLTSRHGKRKKKKLANTLPGLELSSLSHADGVSSNRTDPMMSPIKLELLKEQASKDNRNRKFIQLGEDTSNTMATRTISESEQKQEEAPKLRDMSKHLKRSHSFGDTDLKNMIAENRDNMQVKKKKKHKSSNLASLLSPRRRSRQVEPESDPPIVRNCGKCGMLLDISNSYSCKSCGSIVCKNCVHKSIPKDKGDEMILERNCVTCYYMQCIQSLRTKK